MVTFIHELNKLLLDFDGALAEATGVMLVDHHRKAGTLDDAIRHATQLHQKRFGAPFGLDDLIRSMGGFTEGPRTADSAGVSADQYKERFEAGTLPVMYGQEALDRLLEIKGHDCSCDMCVELRNRIRAGCPIHFIGNDAECWVGQPDVNRAVGLN